MAGSPEKNGVKALYGGSFDPPPLGHLDVIERASRLFSHLEVNVAVNAQKLDSLFDIEQRLKLLTEITKPIGNVTVAHLPRGDYLASYTQDNGFSVLVRGLRTEKDFGEEMGLLKINKLIAPEIDTIYIPCQPHYDAVSSSAVRHVLAVGNPHWQKVVAKMVPDPVLQAIIEHQAALG